MDENKIEKMWQDFANSHKVTIQKEEKQLLIFPDKRKTYSVVESINNKVVLYEYKFHSLDPIGGGALFRIFIPVVTNHELLIHKPSVIRSVLFREKIIIKSSEFFKIEHTIVNSIVHLFKIHPDLKIRLGPSEVSFQSIVRGKTDVLMTQTKHLPMNLKEIEGIRTAMLQLFVYLGDIMEITNDIQ